jgi:hypothetical protein
MNHYKDVKTYLDQKDAGSAFDLIKKQLTPSYKIENNIELKILLELISRSFALFGDESSQAACSKLVNDTTNSNAFYELGIRLTSAQHPGIATAILGYGLSQFPKDERLLHELVASLEIQGLYKIALTYLKASQNREFTTIYLLAFNTLMMGDIDEARKIAVALEPNSTSEYQMNDRLNRIFLRIKAIEGVTSLDASDFRGWHFALTGGLLLHLPDPAKHKFGHYESLEDSNALLKEGIYRLCSIFELWKVRIPRIHSFDNPESHRLGLAFSETLGVPERTTLLPNEPGLFVFYDQANIIRDVLTQISKHAKGVYFYCHGSQFNSEYSVAPDFTNLMYSWMVSPWDRHTIFPPRPDLPTSPPSASDLELAKAITSSDVHQENLNDLNKLLELADAGKAYTAQSMPEGSPRERQWHGRKL